MGGNSFCPLYGSVGTVGVRKANLHTEPPSVCTVVHATRTRRQRETEIAALWERFESLTPCEREVLPLVVSGLPNKQIAAEIGTSETTVKVHRSQLMRKMGADSLPELVRMAEKIGIPVAKA